MNIESLADVALVGAGLLAFLAAMMIVARRNLVCALAAECYFALARRGPRFTRRGFVPVVRVLAATAHAGAAVFCVAGTALVLIGADGLE